MVWEVAFDLLRAWTSDSWRTGRWAFQTLKKGDVRLWQRTQSVPSFHSSLKGSTPQSLEGHSMQGSHGLGMPLGTVALHSTLPKLISGRLHSVTPAHCPLASLLGWPWAPLAGDPRWGGVSPSGGEVPPTTVSSFLLSQAQWLQSWVCLWLLLLSGGTSISRKLQQHWFLTTTSCCHFLPVVAIPDVAQLSSKSTLFSSSFEYTVA